METLTLRIAALEQRLAEMARSAQETERRVQFLSNGKQVAEGRARHWRTGVAGLALLGLVLAPGRLGLAQSGSDVLSQFLQHLQVSADGRDIYLTNTNLHLVNGTGNTLSANGLGNLILGYNEPKSGWTPADLAKLRGGSHNLIIGAQHSYQSYGGLVVGLGNTISGPFASVTGGSDNTAQGTSASVSGGQSNRAIGDYASVSGGANNQANAESAVVSGGSDNQANSGAAAVSGGSSNQANGPGSVVSGGSSNVASGANAAISGGAGNSVGGKDAWVGGGQNQTASQDYAAVGGAGSGSSDVLQAAKSYTDQQVAAEAGARQAADSTLSTKIDQLAAASGALSMRLDQLAATPGSSSFTTDEQRRLKGLADHLLVEGANGQEITLQQANLHIVNGMGHTDGANGLGNLIIGYNETRASLPDGPGGPPAHRIPSLPLDDRSGSHNLVIGSWNNYSSYGGMVLGEYNAISGIYASVTGGITATASGENSSVSGGGANRAAGRYSSVSGGAGNVADGDYSSVSGGIRNLAHNQAASVSGGSSNQANNVASSVSGGSDNQANGPGSAVSGGSSNVASGANAAISGGTGNSASGKGAWVGGGQNQAASQDYAAIGGAGGSTDLLKQANDYTDKQISMEMAARQAADNTLSTRIDGLANAGSGSFAPDAANTLRALAAHLQIDGNEVTLTGANLHIVNGMGRTDSTNQLGNLIIGYDETRASLPVAGRITGFPLDERSGSHNLVIGILNNYSSYGGMVLGRYNAISGKYASVTGGSTARASGESSSVSGGEGNWAHGNWASVSGGTGNAADGDYSWVSGGRSHSASGEGSSVSGGEFNKALGNWSIVTGGLKNTAMGTDSSVSGGAGKIASGDGSWTAGSLPNQ